MDLDAENADALGYARADINSPVKHADSGGRVISPRERVPVPRRNMIPVHACHGATEILKRMAANTLLGDVVDESSEQNRRDAQALSQNAFPVGDVPWETRSRPSVAVRNAAAYLSEHLTAAVNGTLAEVDIESRVLGAFEALFGFHADQAWIPAFLAELRVAALDDSIGPIALQIWTRRDAPPFESLLDCSRTLSSSCNAHGQRQRRRARRASCRSGSMLDWSPT